ncbi:MAG TPA: hypothetical protein VG370_14360 [Chloroflexota bacterium]|nr:hypothetical protein [Chloroflexota bacterium]
MGDASDTVTVGVRERNPSAAARRDRALLGGAMTRWRFRDYPIAAGSVLAALLDYVLLPPGAEALAATRLGGQPDRDGFYGSDHLGLAVTLAASRGSGRAGPRCSCGCS